MGFICIKNLGSLGGNFWGETQGGPGLQIDNTVSVSEYKAKTKTKYRVK